MGKATGFCKGKGGSMHIVDVDSGNLGSNGAVSYTHLDVYKRQEQQ